MANQKNGIEWCDETWNPVRGCSLVSAGCTNCYAMHVAARFSGPGLPYEGLTKKTSQGPKWNGNIMLVYQALHIPGRWTKPRKIFVNSMSDLFHEAIPDEYIDRVFAVMAENSQHTFQVLTKRQERMRAYMNHPDLEDRITELWRCDDKNKETWNLMLPLKNVWLGVSVEDQKAADLRIPILLETPAAVRFLSMEPLLGPVDLESIPWGGIRTSVPKGWTHPKHGIHWVIVGGESGPGARPMHPDWAYSLRDQCAAAGVPFLFKQWGDWVTAGQPAFGTVKGEVRYIKSDGSFWDTPPADENADCITVIRVGKKAAGRLLGVGEHNGYPEAKSCAR